MAANTNPTAVVIDASAVLAQLLPDEDPPTKVSEFFEKFKARELVLISPPLLLYETTNSLKSAVLRERTNERVAQPILSRFIRLPIQYQTPDFTKVLKLAIEHNLSAYDASYLSLALELKVPLITLDKKLTRLATR